MISFEKLIFAFILAVNLLSLLVLAQEEGDGGQKKGLIEGIVDGVGGVLDGIGNTVDGIVKGALGAAGGAIIGAGDLVKGIGDFIKPKDK